MNAPTAVTEGWPLHARFDGPIVMIGFGSIGKGTLPLIERHIAFDRSKFVVIAPEDSDRGLLDERQIQFIHKALTKDNYREILTPLLTAGPGRGMVVNLSVDTSSVALMELCKDLDTFYIDTVVEPWPGLYTDRNRSISERSNYALRESVLDLRRRRPGGITAVSCCGANPGMVSWMVKQALVDIAGELKLDFVEPQSREDWGRLMQRAGVKGIHIAERDTQRARDPKPKGKFVNTWSVEGFISEGLQPSELGWGTHEKTLPSGRRAPRLRLRRRDLPQAAGRRHARALVDADGAGAARLDDHAQRVDLDRRLLHGAGRRQGDLPADLPLRLPSLRRCRALAARDGGRAVEAAADLAHPVGGRHRRRHRRTRRAALRPCQERLLVRVAALDRGDAAAGALPERDRPAGDLGGARRHRVDAGEPRARHRGGGRDGLPPVP